MAGENVTLTDKYCLLQKTFNKTCTEDYECVNTHGCYNKTCIAYFSLPDGHPVEFSPPKAGVSLCKSGFERDMACARLSQAPKTECNDDKPCTYTNFDNSTVIIPQNCLCGYNPVGKKFCKYGSGSAEWVDYVAKQSDLLKDVSKCNTLERKVCSYNKKFPTKVLSDVNQKYLNAKTLAEFAHELILTDKCVSDVAFPDYVPDTPTPPTPTPNATDTTCAKYTCKTKEAKCAHSHWELNVNKTDNITVILSDICNITQTCDVGGRPNDVFYKKTDVDGKCTDVEPFYGIRYPGEACRKDADCYKDLKNLNETLVGTCLNSVCRGYNSTQACQETAYCWVGNYCNSNSTCAPLKKEKENCTLTTECKNNLLCLSGTCQNAWYSLSTGVKVETDGKTPAALYCKFGMADVDGKCDSLNSTDTVDKTANLVACHSGQKCNYTTNAGATTLDCQCGYNADGLAWCPKGHNQGNL
jgi:hypothetical protein